MTLLALIKWINQDWTTSRAAFPPFFKHSLVPMLQHWVICLTAYSLSFSMNDCRGKNLPLFYHLRQHRCGWFFAFFFFFSHSEESPEVSSIVLFLDMTPVGRAPQTKHWAAPALTHGESRGWLQWIKSRTPLPLPKTTRRYHNITVLKMKRKTSIQHSSSAEISHSRHYLRRKPDNQIILYYFSAYVFGLF